MKDIFVYIAHLLVSNKVEALGVLLALYEFLVRVKPTKFNISVLSYLRKIFSTIIPNRDSSGGTY